jgi:hypothetical protein
MSVFQQCWKNWSKLPLGAPDVSTHAWLNELNQAFFAALEKNLPTRVRVSTVSTPTFIYYTEAPGGYGVESHSAVVESRRITLPEGSFNEQVDSAVKQMLQMIVRPSNRTVFVYTPMYPLGELMHDGTKNTRHMVIRMKVVGETIDTERN